MQNRIIQGIVLSGLLGAGCVAAEPTEQAPAPPATQAVEPHVQRMITFVAYYDDAAHTNLVGAATFSACPGDPAYSWGSQTSFYTIESEPCG